MRNKAPVKIGVIFLWKGVFLKMNLDKKTPDNTGAKSRDIKIEIHSTSTISAEELSKMILSDLRKQAFVPN
jgi:hypothetical protein